VLTQDLTALFAASAELGAVSKESRNVVIVIRTRLRVANDCCVGRFANVILALGNVQVCCELRLARHRFLLGASTTLLVAVAVGTVHVLKSFAIILVASLLQGYWVPERTLVVVDNVARLLADGGAGLRATSAGLRAGRPGTRLPNRARRAIRSTAVRKFFLSILAIIATSGWCTASAARTPTVYTRFLPVLLAIATVVAGKALEATAVSTRLASVLNAVGASRARGFDPRAHTTAIHSIFILVLFFVVTSFRLDGASVARIAVGADTLAVLARCGKYSTFNALAQINRGLTVDSFPAGRAVARVFCAIGKATSVATAVYTHAAVG
jgi:hypothetical protein